MALPDLDLPPYLDGETPTRHGDPLACYTPEGEPITGEPGAVWSKIARWKWDPRNFRRTEFMVEGTGEMAVSTVYLGLDHQWSNGGPILIWESMIFGGPFDEYQWRYSTRAAAMAGHQKICDALVALFGNPPQVEVDPPAMRLSQDEGR